MAKRENRRSLRNWRTLSGVFASQETKASTSAYCFGLEAALCRSAITFWTCLFPRCRATALPTSSSTSLLAEPFLYTKAAASRISYSSGDRRMLICLSVRAIATRFRQCYTVLCSTTLFKLSSTAAAQTDRNFSQIGREFAAAFPTSRAIKEMLGTLPRSEVEPVIRGAKTGEES